MIASYELSRVGGECERGLRWNRYPETCLSRFHACATLNMTLPRDFDRTNISQQAALDNNSVIAQSSSLTCM
jgi:hypothetical protein